MMSNLSKEQRLRIEESKKKALALRAAKDLNSNRNIGVNFHQQNDQNANTFTANLNKPGTSPVVSNKSNRISGQKSNAFYKNTIPNFNTQSGNYSNYHKSTKQLVTTNSNTWSGSSKNNIGHNNDNYKVNADQGSKLSGHPSVNTKLSTPKTASYTCHETPAEYSKLVEKVTAPSPTKASLKGKCVLLSSTRFQADIGFNSGVIEVFKTIPSRQYDPENKTWSFDLKDYNELMKKLSGMTGIVYLEPLPRSVVASFSNYISKGFSQSENPPAEVNLKEVDQKLVEALMPFQEQGVRFAVRNKGRVLIADDMGLGKTLQSLCIAAYYKREWPLLIVVPSSVRFTWREQILKWMPSVNPQDINVMVSGKDSATSGLINIISYDLMVKVKKELYDKLFRVIIMDESHSLKNSKTARTQAAQPLLKKASRVILLSGTPALSRPAELFTQISSVDPNIFPKFHDFGIRYCDGKQNPWGWDFTGSSNLAELQLVLEKKIMIRRLKKDVLDQLPSKCRQMVILDPNSVKINKSMKASHSMVDKMKGNERRGALLEYFNETGEAKIKAIREYVLELLEGERKLLLFAHHQVVLNGIEEAVHKKKHEFIRIDGRTSSEQRNTLVSKFQNHDEVKIAILSITAANAGINLTAATLVVFAELFWNPGILMQAEDRAHRIGQRDSVSVHYLVAPGTADDYIWPLVQQKLEVLGKAGLSEDNFSAADTKRLMDPKQKEILDFFEESFIEDDSSSQKIEDTESGANCEGDDKLKLSRTKAGKSTEQISLFQYFKPESTGCINSVGKDSHESVSDRKNIKQSIKIPDTSKGQCDWLDSLDEEWEDESDAPWPPKTKKHKLG